MPKRVPKDEKPFRPVENALVSRLLESGGEATATATEEKPTTPEPEAPPAASVEPAAPVVDRSRDEKVVHMPPKPARAEKAPEEAEPQAKPRPPRTQIERFHMDPDDRRQLQVFATELSEALGTTVKVSNIHRALQILVRNSRAEAVTRARQLHGQVYRPSNENHVAMAEFEHRLAKVFNAANRDAPPLREGGGLS